MTGQKMFKMYHVEAIANINNKILNKKLCIAEVLRVKY